MPSHEVLGRTLLAVRRWAQRFPNEDIGVLVGRDALAEPCIDRRLVVNETVLIDRAVDTRPRPDIAGSSLGLAGGSCPSAAAGSSSVRTATHCRACAVHGDRPEG